jgi:hypothetical protein
MSERVVNVVCGIPADGITVIASRMAISQGIDLNCPYIGLIICLVQKYSKYLDKPCVLRAHKEYSNSNIVYWCGDVDGKSHWTAVYHACRDSWNIVSGDSAVSGDNSVSGDNAVSGDNSVSTVNTVSTVGYIVFKIFAPDMDKTDRYDFDCFQKSASGKTPERADQRQFRGFVKSEVENYCVKKHVKFYCAGEKITFGRKHTECIRNLSGSWEDMGVTTNTEHLGGVRVALNFSQMTRYQRGDIRSRERLRAAAITVTVLALTAYGVQREIIVLIIYKAFGLVVKVPSTTKVPSIVKVPLIV